MVIEDSAVFLERLQPALQELKNVKQVLTGRDYTTGEFIITKYTVHVAILDIHLPGKSGIELLRLIRSRPFPHPILVIMLTDDPDEVKRKACMSLGADHFFDKFEGIDQVTNLIQTHSFN